MPWYDDPKLARQLARGTWLLLVGAFVLLTRFRFASGTHEDLALAALVTVVALMNIPVVLGLYRSRAESHTRAFRAVAIALTMRTLATVCVVAFVGA